MLHPWGIMLGLAGLLLISLAPRPMHAQTPVCSQEIVVQAGETLATIAVRLFGTQDGYAELIAATNAQAAVDSSYTTIDDPDDVEAGWKLCVPADTIPDAPTTTPQMGSIKVAATARQANSSRSSLPHASVALEENAKLLETTLAARMGKDGIHPLSIEYLRRQEYPGSSLTIEQPLPAGNNYRQYLVSYESEGLKLEAAMTVPTGKKPPSGWPVVIFVHGYIEPEIYSPTERYVEYVDAIARNGYIVLRPDLRGHANSQGEAHGAYGDPGYTIDLLNAVASIKQYADADPNRIGMWGHSMGGYLIARAMVMSNDVKAGGIWAGVVAPYEELVARWYRSKGGTSSAISEGELPVPEVLIKQHGTPQENPDFWDSLSANAYASNLSGPVQLHHGTADTDVPASFSDLYYKEIIAAGQTAEFYLYAGDDHNLSGSFEIAMRRTLAFLDAHVKNVAPMLSQIQTSSPAQLVP